ncbi:MAG: GreA/GreB family elongation factor [bacterium]
MTKTDIHQRFIARLTTELESITAVARKTFATATSDEHRAEHKYDTFKLESSFLARGQAKRVEELADALESLQLLPMKEMDHTTPIQLSALVRLKASDGGSRVLFVCAAAGGETIVADGEEITIVTSRSPLGQAVLGKKTGDTFVMKIGSTKHTYKVVSVE